MRKLSKTSLLIICFVFLLIVLGFTLLSDKIHECINADVTNSYESLPKDECELNPLRYLNDDYSLDEKFTSNLPIVIMEVDGELPEYKAYDVDNEQAIYNDTEPWTTGYIKIIDNGDDINNLLDEANWQSDINVKKRGQTTYFYEKPQYSIRLVEDDQETQKEMNVFNMGSDNSWALIGSVVDKSLIRNYVALRISSEIKQDTLNVKFCEVVLFDGEKYVYQGVYLFSETVSRSENRVFIDNFNGETKYTSYILRRDRYSPYDILLDEDLNENTNDDTRIGIKYPTEREITDDAIAYINEDYKMIEDTVYSDDLNVKKAYPDYIDVDSFVDYFIINEYFGNYDAGYHSTYMYKNTSNELSIGPVWDFDQSMDNYFAEEQNTEHMAMQTRAYYEELCGDYEFLNKLEERYIYLRRDVLSDENVFSVIDEAIAYIDSAQDREWYRWNDSYFAEDYEDSRYELSDIEKDGLIISRANDDYDQEIRIIKTYLKKHALAIPEQINDLQKDAWFTTSVKGNNTLIFIIVLILFVVPSIIISKRG